MRSILGLLLRGPRRDLESARFQMPTIDEQLRILSRRCERILTEEDLRRKLASSAKSGKPLRIKLGMDPTAPDVSADVPVAAAISSYERPAKCRRTTTSR